ncbi:MAG: hypothetical protein CMJ49_14855 [Planctomycetaceae bacterium]|nr:hypothetical protein [Planctomycetaceae bacterium]
MPDMRPRRDYGRGRRVPARLDPAALREPFCPADLPALDAYIDLQIPRHRIQSLQPETLAAVRAHYLARVMQIDHAVAALRDAVDRNGHADNTWIIYVSDHGMLLGERGLIGHRSFLANAVYVPLWILPPPTVEITRQDEESDRDSHGLINAVALAPTLCAIVGVDPPTGAAAPSLLPAVSGLPIGHDAMISEYANLLMLETMRYKAVFDTNTTAPLALFDLVKDPEERSDIVDATQSSNVFDMLRWQLAQSLMPLRSGVLAAV